MEKRARPVATPPDGLEDGGVGWAHGKELREDGDGDGDGETRTDELVRDLELPVLRNVEDSEDASESWGAMGERRVLRTEIPDSEAEMEESVSPATTSGVGAAASEADAGLVKEMFDPVVDGSVKTVNGHAPHEAVRREIRSPSPEPPPQAPVAAQEAMPADASLAPRIDDSGFAVAPASTSAEARLTQDSELGVLGDSHFEDALAVTSHVGGVLTQEWSSSLETSREMVADLAVPEPEEDRVRRVAIAVSSAEEDAHELEERSESEIAGEREDVVMSDGPAAEQETVGDLKVELEATSQEEADVDETCPASNPDVLSTASEQQNKDETEDREMDLSPAPDHRHPAVREPSPTGSSPGSKIDDVHGVEQARLPASDQPSASDLTMASTTAILSEMLPSHPTHRTSPKQKLPDEVADSDAASTDSKDEPADGETATEGRSGIAPMATTAARSIPDSDDGDDDEELVGGSAPQKEVKEDITIPATTRPPSYPHTGREKAGECQATATATVTATETPSSPSKPTLGTRPRDPAQRFQTPTASFKAPTPTPTATKTSSPACSPLPKPTTSTSTSVSASDPQPRSQILPLSSSLPNAAPPNTALLTELKRIKLASLTARNALLRAEIASKRAQLAQATAALARPAAAAETVRAHIRLLHEYNDVRDVGMGLLGLVAEHRGVRVGELWGEFGLGGDD